MHRQRLAPGRLGQPLGCPPGRRRQYDFAALQRQNVQHCLHRRGFTGTGTAGHHQHPVVGRRPHRVALRLGQLDAAFLLKLSCQCRNIGLAQFLGMIAQKQQPFGHFAFGVIEMVRINQGLAPGVFHRQRPLPQQLRQHLGHVVAVAGQLLGCRLHQHILRHTGMSSVRRSQQCITNAGGNPGKIRRLHAAGQCDPVCRAKADPVDFLRQTIRVLLDHLHGPLAIHGMDPPGESAGDAA